MKVRYHMDDPFSVAKLSREFKGYLKEIDPSCMRPTIVVCIGTDRATGDCLGPLVGAKLDTFPRKPLKVFGTLDDPVHAKNMEEKLDLIKNSYKNPMVVAVDASLGRVKSVGMITLAKGAIKPGAGVNKTLPEVGDIHYTGIVNIGGYMETMVLQNTRLSVVMKMSHIISTSIMYGARQFYDSINDQNKLKA